MTWSPVVVLPDNGFRGRPQEKLQINQTSNDTANRRQQDEQQQQQHGPLQDRGFKGCGANDLVVRGWGPGKSTSHAHLQ
jgi:hypothetical protein